MGGDDGGHQSLQRQAPAVQPRRFGGLRYAGVSSDVENDLGIVVYWLEEVDEGEGPVPCCQFFGGKELTQALAWAEDRRRQGHRHVSISTELDDHVGLPGVAAVEGGRTPDGHAYEWSKAGRAGKVRKR